MLEKQVKSGIYCIKNKINNKIYIGSTLNFDQRWKHHIGCLNRNNHVCGGLQNAWNKYGCDNFIFEILEIVERNDLAKKEFLPILWKKEQIYLDKYWDNCKECYNICSIAGNTKGVSTILYQKDRLKTRQEFKNIVYITKTCACGCGKTMTLLPQRRNTKYIIGHNNRGKSPSNKGECKYPSEIYLICRECNIQFISKLTKNYIYPEFCSKSCQGKYGRKQVKNPYIVPQYIINSPEARMKKALAQRGDKNNHAKLMEKQVVEIKEKYKKYLEYAQSKGQNRPPIYNKLACEYNVSYDAIRNIIKGKSWSHIK